MKYEQATEFYLLYLKEVTRPFITTYPHFYSYLSSSFLTFSSILSILFYSIYTTPLLFSSLPFIPFLSSSPSYSISSSFLPIFSSLSLSLSISVSLSLSPSLYLFATRSLSLSLTLSYRCYLHCL